MSAVIKLVEGADRGPFCSRQAILNKLPFIVLLLGNALVVVRDAAHPSFATIRSLYDFNTLLLPAYLALHGLGVMVFRKQRRRCTGQWRRRARPWFAAAIGLVALRVYATHVEPTRTTTSAECASCVMSRCPSTHPAGAGSEHKDDVPPLRFMCPTEMTLIELVPKGETHDEK